MSASAASPPRTAPSSLRGCIELGRRLSKKKGGPEAPLVMNGDSGVQNFATMRK